MSGIDVEAIKESPLWNHMAQVLSKVIMEQPADALEAVGPTSHYVLTGQAVPPKTTSVYAESRPFASWDVPQDAVSNTRWAANFGTTLAPPRPRRRPLEGEEDAEDEELAADAGQPIPEEELPGTIADIVTEQRTFNSVGTGLSAEESFRVVVGMKTLVRSEPIATVRLWGKILGSRNDYYIAEATLDPSRVAEDEEDEEEAYEDEDEGAPVEQIADVLSGYRVKRHRVVPSEEKGTGLNEYVYYVSTSADPTHWARLPDTTPEHIRVARLVRKAFTGDLDAVIHTQPAFPGKEKHYLRAQIARIQCATKVAPRDIYLTEGAVPEMEEDDEGNVPPPPSRVPAYTTVLPLIPQDTPEEDDVEAIEPVRAWFSGYSADELLQSKQWVHTAPTLLACGRATAAPQQEEDQADLADADVVPEAPVDRTELIAPFLSELAKDAALHYPGHSRVNFPAWTFRKELSNESSTNCTYCARSHRWPGAVACAVTTRGKPGAVVSHMYVGAGLKGAESSAYVPALPPRTLVEYPEDGVTLQRDCTVDEELEYVPMPPPPAEDDEEEMEGEEDY